MKLIWRRDRMKAVELIKQHFNFIFLVATSLSSYFYLSYARQEYLTRSFGYDDNSSICNIRRLHSSELDCETFVNEFMGKQPVIIRDLTDNSLFRSRTKFSNLLKQSGHLNVSVSTSNSYTGRINKLMTLEDYLLHVLKPQDSKLNSNQTFYLFGDQQGLEWEELVARYNIPYYPSESIQRGGLHASSSSKQLCSLMNLYKKQHQNVDTPPSSVTAGIHRTRAFGIAGRNTGVMFHFHGPGFIEMLHGMKKWLLYPPDTDPPYFDPNMTTLEWMEKVYPQLPAERKPVECVIFQNEVLYFPNQWLHATLNLADYNVFVATFA